MKAPLFRQIASRIQALSNCIASGNTEWRDKHESAIETLVKDFMPSGSGIDSGTSIDLDECLRVGCAKLVFTTDYHHMNDGGMYDGWTEHKVIVTPSLTSKFDLKITGRDRNQIKEYLTDVFDSALSEEIEGLPDGSFVSPARIESARKFQEGVKNGSIT